MVIAYKWGGIAFDDYSLIKTLVLPSDAEDDVPITFHDEDGNNYQVPGGKVFIVGKVMVSLSSTTIMGRVGESNTADGAISKEIVSGLYVLVASGFLAHDVLGVYATGKYVTGESNHSTSRLNAGTTVYGVEIPV